MHRYISVKNEIFEKKKILRYFLALGDTIPEIGQVKSARKVYFFSLKSAINFKKSPNFENLAFFKKPIGFD